MQTEGNMSREKDKQIFTKKVENMLAASTNTLTIPNVEFVEWADNFNINNSRKQWSFMNARWVGGLNIIFVLLFGKKRFGYEIYYREQIDLADLWKAYNGFAPFDLENEIPLTLYCESKEEGFLITNMHVYFSLPKSKKIKHSFKRSTGRVGLHSITSIDIKRGHFYKDSADIIINGELLGGINFWVARDARILKKFFAEFLDNNARLITYRPTPEKISNQKDSLHQKNIPTQLGYLKKLLDGGIIDEDEFTAKKRELLERM